jgi:hypothetical protein
LLLKFLFDRRRKVFYGGGSSIVKGQAQWR